MKKYVLIVGYVDVAFETSVVRHLIVQGRSRKAVCAAVARSLEDHEWLRTHLAEVPNDIECDPLFDGNGIDHWELVELSELAERVPTPLQTG